jgi:hypothetical protein
MNIIKIEGGYTKRVIEFFFLKHPYIMAFQKID